MLKYTLITFCSLIFYNTYLFQEALNNNFIGTSHPYAYGVNILQTKDVKGHLQYKIGITQQYILLQMDL